MLEYYRTGRWHLTSNFIRALAGDKGFHINPLPFAIALCSFGANFAKIY
jgi:hypothetical protein